MSADQFTGPALMVPHGDEVCFQFGVRMPNGVVVRLGRDVRAPLNQLVRRRVVPIEDWQEVGTDDLA